MGQRSRFRIESLAHDRPSTITGNIELSFKEPTKLESALQLFLDLAHMQIRALRGPGPGMTWYASHHDLTAKSVPELSRPAFVPPSYKMSAEQVGQIWDGLAFRAGEDRVIRGLQVIAPIERLTLVDDPMNKGARVVMARVIGATEPIPLKAMGDGVLRVFQLALAVERSLAPHQPHQLALDERVLLVDEIETGVHYGVLPDVWRYLFQTARENDLQVFATTHSWDCIEAFQQAAAEEPEGSALLMRLEQKGGEHRAVLFDQDELPTITKHHIEVR